MTGARAAIADAPQIVVPMPIRHRIRQSIPSDFPSHNEQIRPDAMVTASSGSEPSPVRTMSPRSRLAPNRMIPPFRQSLLVSDIRSDFCCAIEGSTLAIKTPIAIANSGAPISGAMEPPNSATTPMPTQSNNPRPRRTSACVAARDCIGNVNSWAATLFSPSSAARYWARTEDMSPNGPIIQNHL